jgi:hypothetical protein
MGSKFKTFFYGRMLESIKEQRKMHAPEASREAVKGEKISEQICNRA